MAARSKTFGPKIVLSKEYRTFDLWIVFKIFNILCLPIFSKSPPPQTIWMSPMKHAGQKIQNGIKNVTQFALEVDF